MRRDIPLSMFVGDCRLPSLRFGSIAASLVSNTWFNPSVDSTFTEMGTGALGV